MGTELDREQLLEEALALVDEVGLNGFTMRGLAGRLQVAQSALYWHLSSKEALLGEVAATLLTPTGLLPERTTAPRARLEAVADAMRQALHAHPKIAPIVGGQLLASANAAPLAEYILQALSDGGTPHHTLIDAFNAYVGSVLGWAVVELSSPPTGTDWQQPFADSLDALDPATYPTLTWVLADARDAAFMLRWTPGEHHHLDAGFTQMLAALLTGLLPPT